VDTSQTEFDVVGKTAGAKTVTLTTSNLPSHTHSAPSHNHDASHNLSVADGGGHSHTPGSLVVSILANGAHTHTFASGGNHDNTTTGGSANRASNLSTGTTSSGGSHGHSGIISGATSEAPAHSHTLSGGVTVALSGATTTGATGSGTATTTLSPSLAMNFIIRAA